jgi:flagellar hook-associated protein 3 FlgL
MPSNLVSGLVQTRITQRNIARIQGQSNERSVELSTGKKADLVRDLGGEVRNYLDLSSVRQNLINRKDRMITGDNRLAQMEVGLEQLNIQTEPYRALTAQIGILDKKNLKSFTGQASSTLQAVSNAMNLQWGGRYLFGGDAVDDRPMQNIESLVTTVEGIINTHATAAGGTLTTQAQMDAMTAEIDTVFDDTHPDLTKRFTALVYRGGTGDMPGIEMAIGEVMNYDVKADATAIRNLTRSLAMLSANETLETVVPPSADTLPSDLHESYLKKAALTMESAILEVVELRTQVGFKQQRLDQTMEGLETVIFRYNERVGLYENADPYEAGVAFNELQQQLQSSFYVTAKLSEQSLVNYLR